ncbi:MAG: VWA domain-containing protein [Hyphomicrobiaceae bacterium]
MSREGDDLVTGPEGAGGASFSAPQRLDANIIAAEVDGGRIAENILYFARLLRASGLEVGPQKTVLATEAVLAAGIENPWTLYWTLAAVFVNRRSELEVFNQAFVMFWKDPGYIEQMMSLMLPKARPEKAADDKALSRRVTESLFRQAETPAPSEEDRVDFDAELTWSAEEKLKERDFEEMSADELRRAKRAIERMRLPFEEIRTRRFVAAGPRESLDMRRILRGMAAKGSDHIVLHHRSRRWRRPPVVVLVDISGSMESYARVFLHFLYALTGDRDRVSSFLFGTRLSHVTRLLKDRDPDKALARIGHEVTDWSGGTRIGECLAEFNRRWARRVLGQNAVVLLFTDGLDREGGEGIEREARRLAANARRLVWLNPLMRYDRYEPVATGASMLARHVSEMRSCHNLRSLEEVARALSASTSPAPLPDLSARRHIA